MITADKTAIIRERQLAMRREMDRRGIALKVVSFDSGIPYATLLTYFPVEGSREPAVMPVSAAFSLVGAVPDDLINLLVPEGYALVRVPGGVDFDQISGACRDFVNAKEEAHHPESEAGRDIGPTESSNLHRLVPRAA